MLFDAIEDAVFENVNSSAIALGASASVMAIVVGIGTYSPNYAIRLLFLGDVKLKYIAIFSFVISLTTRIQFCHGSLFSAWGSSSESRIPPSV